MQRLKFLLLLLAILVLSGQALAGAETLIDETDQTEMVESETQAAFATCGYFVFDVTAIDTGTVQIQVRQLLPDLTFAAWYNGPTISSVDDQRILLCNRDYGSPGMTSLASSAADVKLSVPMPPKWQIRMVPGGSSTASYTVKFWRY